MYAFKTEDESYGCEAQINYKCGISIYNYLIYVEQGNPMVNGMGETTFAYNTNKVRHNECKRKEITIKQVEAEL